MTDGLAHLTGPSHTTGIGAVIDHERAMSEAPAAPEKKTITIPTKGRVVTFTAHVGFDTTERIEYAGIVVGHQGHGVVDLVTFGPNSVYHNEGIPYDANGHAKTWRYPDAMRDTLDLNENGTVDTRGPAEPSEG